MSLPMYKYPVYSMTLPSTKKLIKYRPFLVKDEKNLMLAQQSEDEMNMLDTLKIVVKDCILDKAVNVEDLPIFDLEYLFAIIRSKSVGEDVTLIFTCKNQECKQKTNITFRIDPQLIIPEGHTNKIELFDDVGVVMKYPNAELMKQIEKIQPKDAEGVIDLIVKSIDYIYDKESVYHAKEQTEAELIQFVENLPKKPTENIKKFFATSPRLEQKVEYVCPHCKTENEYTIEGIDSFF
jgi:hypothetical protein